MLRNVGITGKHHGLNFSLYANEDEKREVAKLLHTLNHTCSAKRLDKIVQGAIPFVPRPLKLRGKVEWDDNIKQISSAQTV